MFRNQYPGARLQSVTLSYDNFKDANAAAAVLATEPGMFSADVIKSEVYDHRASSYSHKTEYHVRATYDEKALVAAEREAAEAKKKEIDAEIERRKAEGTL